MTLVESAIWTLMILVALAAIFWMMEAGIARLSPPLRRIAIPMAFMGPGLIFIMGAYIVPTIMTIIQSFQHRRTGEFVGLANYERVLSNSQAHGAFINTLLWLVLVPTFCVIIGLVVAGLTDRLPKRVETFFKSLIFMPMAISFIGATAIWSLVYAFQPVGRPQVGIVNEIITAFDGIPRPWIIVSDYKLNTLALSMIMVWMFAGFAMVNLSASIKSVPEETVEAARLEGASSFTIFWKIIVPQIRTTIVTVFTAIAILSLKIFDVVYSMTGGRYDTDVVGNLYFTQAFVLRDRSFASVLIVLLLISVIPFMWLNVRQFSRKNR
ncbi:MAG: sugar ABC transporter permease [Rhodobacteraceae bacterium]|nr:sugar ABC transporter permease [Paracoccaceae bacterium]